MYSIAPKVDFKGTLTGGKRRSKYWLPGLHIAAFPISHLCHLLWFHVSFILGADADEEFLKDIGSSRSGSGAASANQKAAGIESALGGTVNDGSALLGPRSEKTGLLTDSSTGNNFENNPKKLFYNQANSDLLDVQTMNFFFLKNAMKFSLRLTSKLIKGQNSC